jgi:RNA 3'-terminal phosphate cyclase (ATP)
VSSLIEIDGSYGEGGGQILRTAIALSALTGKATRVTSIRAGRKNPGLAAQHLTGVLAAARISAAEVQGAEIGSTEVLFAPRVGVSKENSFEFDVTKAARGGSAGSVTLVLQTVLFPLAFVDWPVELKLKGGTHVAWSPPFDYIADVFLPMLSRMGLDAGCRLDAWGFYPVGGGEVGVRIGGVRSAGANRGAFGVRSTDGIQNAGGTQSTGGPAPRRSLEPLRLTERGNLIHITGRAVVSNLSKDIADRMARRATEIFGDKEIDADIQPLRVGGKSTGAGIFLTARYAHTLAGFSALGKRGVPAERVALDACREFFAFDKTGAAVDRHLADQLVLPMALASGRSEMSVECVTTHLLTNTHVIRQFIPATIEIDGEESEPGRVVVEGIGR